MLEFAKTNSDSMFRQEMCFRLLPTEEKKLQKKLAFVELLSVLTLIFFFIYCLPKLSRIFAVFC